MMKWLVSVGLFRLFVAALLLLLSLDVSAQVDSSRIRSAAPSAVTARPGYCAVAHNVGKLQLNVTNYGRLGIGISTIMFDCFTGQKLRSSEYPIGTNNMYLHRGGLWIGGVVGTDTLVSAACDIRGTAREFHPEPSPFGDFTHKSRLNDSPWYAEDATSDQDLIAVYTDTLTNGNPYPSFDAITSRAHKPLGIEVVQKSYAWSYGYSDDFVLINCIVTNISDQVIHDMYFGVYMDMDIQRYAVVLSPSGGPEDKPFSWGRDDVTGFISTYEASYGGSCEFEDTLNLAWTGDNDGDYSRTSGQFNLANVTGVRFLSEPRNGRSLSYNWWVPNNDAVWDFGPQKRATYRHFSGHSGTPTGDLYKYHVLRNREIDYPLYYLRMISLSDIEWVYPNQTVAENLYVGNDNHWVLSAGPWTLEPGETIEVPFVYVGAEGWHRDRYNALYNLTWGYHPDKYIEGLNVDEFATNAMWASRIYDNPGVDTDGDGDSGKVHVCVLDSALIDGVWTPNVVESTYYDGDGHPDWRAATAPPPPKFWVSRIENGLRVRFNGQHSETTKDYLSNLYDFEGYRVYLARDERESSYSLAASYDIENYDAYVYNPKLKPKPGFQLSGTPMSLQQVRCRFSDAADPCNDSLFNPLDFSPASPYRSTKFFDTVAYFTKHDYNASQLGVTSDIRKRFPEAVRPVPGDSVTPDMLTEDGYLKYFEYECDIEGLLPTVPYWLSVTAFDFGSPAVGLEPLESSRTLEARMGYAASTGDQLDGTLPPVFIYPNPYRIDADYRGQGYEGRGQFDQIGDRLRAIHFENLPAKCTIRIFTLDGDLVREIQHDVDPSDPAAAHDKWDLISRNIQMVVSGIYYWAVEEPNGQVQMGKLVIIM